MSIFNRNVIRYYENITTPRVVPGAHDDIAMVVNMFTREAFTQHYDYMQVYYHGGGVYTFMALVVDNASGLRIAHGPILDAVLAYQPHTRKTKTIDLAVNPFTGEQIALNLHIKTMATCVINNDGDIVKQLGEPWTVATIDGKQVQLFDARHNEDVTEAGMWISPTAQFVEFRHDVNEDFTATVASNLEATRRSQSSSGEWNPRMPHIIASKMVSYHLPNLQRQLFNERIAPCMEQPFPKR